MIEITLDSAIEGVTAIVDEYGEGFLYEPGIDNVCLYVRDGSPDCIVGKFLAAQGITLERLEEADRYGGVGGADARTLLDQLRSEGIVRLGAKVVTFFRVLQDCQDTSHAWGEALRSAKRHVGR